MGIGIFYKLLTFLTRFLGSPFFILVSYIIALSYFFLFPRRAALSVRFYRLLFPESSNFRHIWLALRQYLNFTYLFLDRLMIGHLMEFSFQATGWEHLEKLTKDNQGALILMSHIGNWEVAARLMKKNLPQVKLLLYLGVKQQEQIEQIQKEHVSQEGIQVKGITKEGGSPLELMEALYYLKNGGLVSMTGDLIWNLTQRKIAVSFLGKEIYVPEAPHALALLSGSPILIFFAVRDQSRRYRFFISEPYYVCAAERSQRGQAIAESAQHYAQMLETTVKQYPTQWYHFSDIFAAGKKPKND